MVLLRGLSERVCAGTLRRILVYSGEHNNTTRGTTMLSITYIVFCSAIMIAGSVY